MTNQSQKIFPVSLFAAAGILLGIAGLTPQARAAETAPAMAHKTASPGKMMRSESPATRVTRLHDELGIIPSQEAQWSSVASVMLDNASAVDNAIKERVQMTKDMTAIDDLKSYEAIVEAHAEGIKKLAVAFRPLYEAMPVEQQKNADAVFGRRTGPAKLKNHA